MVRIRPFWRCLVCSQCTVIFLCTHPSPILKPLHDFWSLMTLLCHPFPPYHLPVFLYYIPDHLTPLNDPWRLQAPSCLRVLPVLFHLPEMFPPPSIPSSLLILRPRVTSPAPKLRYNLMLSLRNITYSFPLDHLSQVCKLGGPHAEWSLFCLI